MAVRNRVSTRMIGLFVRWGLINHPYGREYARDNYTLSGRRVPNSAHRRLMDAATEAAFVTAGLLLLSLLTTGILLG